MILASFQPGPITRLIGRLFSLALASMQEGWHRPPALRTKVLKVKKERLVRGCLSSCCIFSSALKNKADGVQVNNNPVIVAGAQTKN